MSRRVPVSIVCVWNNEAVRSECLDRSIERLMDEAPSTEYLPVDNRGQVHTTAGSALNQGVRGATRDVVAFIQQDIYLHSLEALERAAGFLMDDRALGLLGAVGITADGRIIGRMRDRVVLIGESHESPYVVDSLDEVLFLARREDLLADPISELPDLAWHAYAVEYGLRLRERGLQVAAIDIPMTHNSLSNNLARLDKAHAAVGRLHPSLLPIQTTCGTVTEDVSREEKKPFLAKHRWRLRWLRKSVAARKAKKATGERDIVLADLREDIDLVLAQMDGVLEISNIVAVKRQISDDAMATLLRRESAWVSVRSAPWDDFDSAALRTGNHLVNNIDTDQLGVLTRQLQGVPHLIGFHEDTGYWLLVGDVAHPARQLWTTPQTRPSRLLV